MTSKDRKAFYNRRSYAKKLGLTLEEYDAQRMRRKSLPESAEKERRRMYDRRAYAKRLGITVEALEARLAAKKAPKPPRKRKPKQRQIGLRESELLRLREKHKAFEGTRLSESINKPEYLTR